MVRGIAGEWAGGGATFVVASRTWASCGQVVGEIKAGGGKAIGIACDMGHAAQIRPMVAETAQKLGGVDILVNNAQGFGTREPPMRANPPTPLETFSEDARSEERRVGKESVIRVDFRGRRSIKKKKKHKRMY